MTSTAGSSDASVPGPPISELIRAGNFKYVGAEFQPENRGRWIDFGDRVRGEFILLEYGNEYYREYLDSWLRFESKQRGVPVHYATAYEAIFYAANGWDGQRSLVAFGSIWEHEGSGRCVTELDWDSKGPYLSTNLEDLYWAIEDSILCVVETVQPSS